MRLGGDGMELHIRNVSKTCSNGVKALKDLTLTIPMGMYGLLGPNSSGKSSMRPIATLQEPDEGRICLGYSSAPCGCASVLPWRSWAIRS